MNKRYLRNLRKLLPAIMMCGAGVGLTACFDDAESTAEKYKDWRELNEKYVQNEEARTENGKPYYTRITPTWAPNAYVLVHWHNDRSLTQNNLSPMDNSTVQITYELFDIDGNRISDSFAKADSIYTSRPNQNIIGMWAAMTHMNVGDSVTMVIPSQAGYGEIPNGDIKPYSTLVYNVKMKAITAYEIP